MRHLRGCAQENRGTVTSDGPNDWRGRGAPLPDPGQHTGTDRGSRLKLAKQQREQLEAEAEPPPVKGKQPKAPKPAENIQAGDLLRPQALELHPKVKTKQKGTSHMLLAFLLFAVIGAATGYLRYGSELKLPGSEHLPAKLITDLMQYAWGGILLLNLIVALKAMSDDMFQGILCLFIPGWSFVYLLFISDNFYLRAVFFGCLVGIGQDGAMQLYDIAASAMNAVSNFINTGGGDVRRTDPSF
ncbi:hypothetical protein GW813_13555 [bacterium]|nr:hypothetical protein [bacterium]